MSTLQENQSLNAEYERNKKEREMKEEIERLKNDNEYLNQVNIELSTEKNRLNNLLKETSQTLSEQTTKAITLKSENERLKNDIKRITNICNEKIKIINDVREYIGSKEHYEDDFDTEIEKIYKILEKENK